MVVKINTFLLFHKKCFKFIAAIKGKTAEIFKNQNAINVLVIAKTIRELVESLIRQSFIYLSKVITPTFPTILNLLSGTQYCLNLISNTYDGSRNGNAMNDILMRACRVSCENSLSALVSTAWVWRRFITVIVCL